jgi:hypothetical protein
MRRITSAIRGRRSSSAANAEPGKSRASTGSSVDRRQLAEQVAGAAHGDDGLAARSPDRSDLHAPVQQHDDGAAVVALVHERDAGAVGTAPAARLELVALVVVQRVQERFRHRRPRASHGTRRHAGLTAQAGGWRLAPWPSWSTERRSPAIGSRN